MFKCAMSFMNELLTSNTCVNKMFTTRLISSNLFKINTQFINNLSKNLSSFALVYEEFGDPVSVLRYKDISDSIKSPTGNQILIQYLASPINPADINTIQGVYAYKPKLPAVGGGEGVAKVVKIGDEVKNVSVDDWVIPAQPGSGTWRMHLVVDSNDVIKIDKTIDIFSAAQLTVNPCTAYRMLKDFVNLKEGDSVIQNGANSAVGLYVIQLAKHWGLKTINVVRDRPELSQLKTRLQSLGADAVVTEEELRQRDIMENVFSKIPKPKLALNCVGGKNATDCLRFLDFRGYMVTYGGMSKQPLTVPTGSLIFKDQKFVGYWMTRWSNENEISKERINMLKDLCDLIKQGKLKTPETKELSLRDYKIGVQKSMQGFADAKYIFTMK